MYDTVNETTLHVLGMSWHTENDSLWCGKIGEEVTKITKRHILQKVASIFDPLAMLSPITIQMKILLQDTWLQGFDWDDDLPNEMIQHFLKWQGDIKKVIDIKIPRWLYYETAAYITLHCFCDSSNRAYATVIYMKSSINNKVKINLVLAKSKVKPTKEISIPRLELLACLIGARLVNYVKDCLKIDCKTFYWSDSMVALGWIHSRVDRWKPFIANRVQEIQSLSEPSQW